MKKTIVTVIALVLCVVSVVLLASCSGEELNFGKKYVPAKAQIDILTELNSKTADIGVMDSVMAGYYLKNSEYADKLTLVEGLTLADENYGIAGRKGSQIINAINQQLIALTENGMMGDIAAAYGLQNEICVDVTQEITVDTTESDYQYIINKGKVIVGYTLFAPIAYKVNEQLVGFDIDLAKKVFADLGLEVEFQLIDWETKEVELEAKTIDLIWNGMTITDERLAAMEISIPYMKNKQVAIIRSEDADKYTSDTSTWSDAVLVAESGSAGEGCIVKSK